MTTASILLALGQWDTWSCAFNSDTNYYDSGWQIYQKKIWSFALGHFHTNITSQSVKLT